jgi:glucose-1-phosphate thymidylyltransferase
MRGVILAGGTGTRLMPCTRVTNKHLLPVYNNPMIFHPLETLKKMSIKDILIVAGGESIGDFMHLLGSGEEFGVNFTYRIQDKPFGIAHAISFAEDFSKGEKIIVILGDNIFENVNLTDDLLKEDGNATIFIKEVEDAERFGVVCFGKNGDVTDIEEKPKQPKSKFAVTGLYIYPPDVFDFIRTLEPSARNELEITDVNNYYIKNRKMKVVKIQGFWSDAGTFPSLFRASQLVKMKEEDVKT